MLRAGFVRVTIYAISTLRSVIYQNKITIPWLNKTRFKTGNSHFYHSMGRFGMLSQSYIDLAPFASKILMLHVLHEWPIELLFIAFVQSPSAFNNLINQLVPTPTRKPQKEPKAVDRLIARFHFI